MYKHYTGIGARATPREVMNVMYGLAKKLASLNYVLRSGKAAGADTAFQYGAQAVKGKTEIFVPWKNFGTEVFRNPHASKLDHSLDVLATPQQFAVAENIARGLHPNWNACSQGVRKLHTRNVFQILGVNCNTPSSFVLYYAPVIKDVVQGGTATAIRLAKQYNIPTINLLNKDWEEQFNNIIKGE